MIAVVAAVATEAEVSVLTHIGILVLVVRAIPKPRSCSLRFDINSDKGSECANVFGIYQMFRHAPQSIVQDNYPNGPNPGFLAHIASN